MKTFVLPVVVGLAILGLLAALPGTAADKDVGPYVSLSGKHSMITERSYLRIATHDAWTKLWLRHVGQPPVERYDEYYNPAARPLVDFDKCQVLAILQGKRWNSAGVKVVSAVEEETVVRVRFDDKSFQTMGGAEAVTAYGIFVMPKTTKPILLEENIQGLIGGDPIWKERARLE
jgi:hypothetical protein